ncbi:Propionyl-CoA carboxylase beta chain, mitochondrial [Hondaea fermentalgiana]|uniref:Propionyl-CoA carboxylase beta chain, mitochondrial n=1 Tax=Hondaea fermentalgiana TaxID=2315210 RepID=A0A2R5GSW0_9STRA|nr:Propionyl-CoA carboxylase beta chain, mitochondrial [Hondaea fermentalgiana]|eukprot:GBG32848.1 Propionyl-CoA carboxylase beta chain, mitochondrial [Hondaea fermentalgiana]
MKMDTILRAPVSGTIESLHVRKGSLLANPGDSVAWIRPASASEADQRSRQGKSAALEEHEAELARARKLRDEILRARDIAAEMGGPDNVKRHHERGRLTIRERIDGMLDASSFREMGRAAPGNFVVGTGRVQERPVVVGGEDFTISGGSPTFAGLRKSVYVETLALQLRVPLIRLHEGGGGSVAGAGGKDSSDDKNGNGLPKPQGDAVYNRPRFESVRKVLDTVPVACAALGPVAGLPASRLVASHFSVMTENAQVLIAGPQVVQRALGYETTKEKLGGPEVHLASGVVDNLASSEEDAFAQISRFLSYLPTCVGEVPPVDNTGADPRDRQDEELLTAVSSLHRRQVYDVRQDIMERVVDRGSLFEMTPHFGPGIVTALARIAGKPVGIIANDCKFHGGAMTADGARKTKRFMETCEQFSLPIVFFVDEPGFMIGEEAERQATIRAGTEAVLTGASLSVPSASVVIRKAYGVAGAAHFGPEGRTFIWPSAEVGALPVESGVAVAFKRMLDAIEDNEEREARRKELEDQFSARLSPMSRAVGFAAHDIIVPTETRPVLADWLDLAWPLVERNVAAKKARSLLSSL